MYKARNGLVPRAPARGSYAQPSFRKFTLRLDLRPTILLSTMKGVSPRIEHSIPSLALGVLNSCASNYHCASLTRFAHTGRYWSTPIEGLIPREMVSHVYQYRLNGFPAIF